MHVRSVERRLVRVEAVMPIKRGMWIKTRVTRELRKHRAKMLLPLRSQITMMFTKQYFLILKTWMIQVMLDFLKSPSSYLFVARSAASWPNIFYPEIHEVNLWQI